MKRAIFLTTAIVLFSAGSAYALWSVSNTGAWPDSWPEEMEPLREQSSSIRGGLVDLSIHHIPFESREEFEAAWPHIVAVKSEGAPIVLVRSPGEHWHFGETDAGVLIHCPPSYKGDPTGPAVPVEGVTDVKRRWMNTIYIELVVDGEIVDLNRIRLPADTPIVDLRFEAEGDE